MAPKRKAATQNDVDPEDVDREPKPKQTKLDGFVDLETNEKVPAEEAAEPREPSKEVQQAEEALEDDDTVLDHGRIFFAYKPRVNVEHPHSIDDVARLRLILKPHEGPMSMIMVGRKYLPDAESSRQPIWAFVKEVSEDGKNMLPHLQASEYETKTRGTSHVPEDRVFAEGPYAIVLQKGKAPSDTRTSLCYVLEAPSEAGEVQHAFNVESQGSIGISVKNPKTGNPPQAGLKEHAKFPDELQSQFGSRRWNAVTTSAYLQYENAELLLLAQKADVAEDNKSEELEAIAQEDAAQAKQAVKTISQKIFDDLGARASKGDVNAGAAKGTWA